MTAQTVEMSADLVCDDCGYDLRAHRQEGKCPECGKSVAESQRLAAFPRRPEWRDSDPRWRRRMLAGAWILALAPLMHALQIFGWASAVPVPSLFGSRCPLHTLDETFLMNRGVYQPLLFCIGVVLLFSKERGRRPAPLDWTRRWGVICAYVTFLLSAAPILLISALVLNGIARLFLTMPVKYQPGMTQWFVGMAGAYLRYGPYAKAFSSIVLSAFSSIAILLACFPLFDALRSSGPKRAAAILVTLLAVFSLMNLAQAVRDGVCFPRDSNERFSS